MKLEWPNNQYRPNRRNKKNNGEWGMENGKWGMFYKLDQTESTDSMQYKRQIH